MPDRESVVSSDLCRIKQPRAWCRDGRWLRRPLSALLRVYNGFEGAVIRMECDMYAALDTVEGYAMGNQLFQRKLAAEDEAGGFGLEVDIGAIRAQQDALANADVRAAKSDALFGGSLRKQQNFGPGTRDSEGLLDETRSVGGHDDGICPSSAGCGFEGRFEIGLQRIEKGSTEALGVRA